MTEANRCPELEKALNSIPGLKSSDAYYMNAFGNDDGESINVWIDVRDQRVLFPLGRCLDRRYGDLDWSFQVGINDTPDNILHYHLQSRSVGKEAIEESIELAFQLSYFMNDKSTIEHFGLDKVFEEQTILDNRDYREKNLEKVLGNQ